MKLTILCFYLLLGLIICDPSTCTQFTLGNMKKIPSSIFILIDDNASEELTILPDKITYGDMSYPQPSKLVIQVLSSDILMNDAPAIRKPDKDSFDHENVTENLDDEIFTNKILKTEKTQEAVELVNDGIDYEIPIINADLPTHEKYAEKLDSENSENQKVELHSKREEIPRLNRKLIISFNYNEKPVRLPFGERNIITNIPGEDIQGNKDVNAQQKPGTIKFESIVYKCISQIINELVRNKLPSVIIGYPRSWIDSSEVVGQVVITDKEDKNNNTYLDFSYNPEDIEAEERKRQLEEKELGLKEQQEQQRTLEKWNRWVAEATKKSQEENKMKIAKEEAAFQKLECEIKDLKTNIKTIEKELLKKDGKKVDRKKVDGNKVNGKKVDEKKVFKAGLSNKLAEQKEMLNKKNEEYNRIKAELAASQKNQNKISKSESSLKSYHNYNNPFSSLSHSSSTGEDSDNNYNYNNKSFISPLSSDSLWTIKKPLSLPKITWPHSRTNSQNQPQQKLQLHTEKTGIDDTISELPTNSLSLSRPGFVIKSLQKNSKGKNQGLNKSQSGYNLNVSRSELTTSEYSTNPKKIST
jgi:hypothetical protein